MMRHLTCCICGEDAGRFQQHWNRDHGWGICARCAAEQALRETPEELERLYGKPGINYAGPTEAAALSARAECERRFTAQGARAPREAANPYVAGCAAAAWWQRGHDRKEGMCS